MSEEYLKQLSEELRQLSGEIAAMKEKALKMEHGPEKEKFKREIRAKQYQALFYIEKIENLSKEAREKEKHAGDE